MTDASTPETDTPTSATSKQATLEVLDFDEADARLDELLSCHIQQSCGEDVALFDGDLTIDGSFSDAMKSLGVANIAIIAISGNLTVNGPIDLYDYTPCLYVGGLIWAETLECEDSEVYVTGTIKYAVYCCGNEGMGDVDVSAPWVINHGRILSCEPREALIVDTRHPYWRGADARVDFDESNLVEAFVAEVVDHEENEIRFDKFLERLRAGQPVLREGARTLDEATADHVAAAIASGASTLDLTDRRLKALPAGVTAMPTLRRLIVDDNPIGHLPDDIGELAHLEELSVRKCGLTKLPESIGRLGQLRILRVSDNAVRREPFPLPDSIGELVNLEELELSALSAGISGELWATPFPLPEALGRLTSLRRLVADGTGVVIPPQMRGLASLREIQIRGGSRNHLPGFPDGLTSFPNLTMLDLAQNLFFEIPDSLLDLVHLEELNLGNSLGPMKTPLPDLSRLPKLRVLRLTGGTSEGRRPGHDLLRPLFSMPLPAIEDIAIGLWGDENRGPLTPDMLTGIGAWQTLRRLDLVRNGLTDLPDELLDLPHLEWLNLERNNFNHATRQRITAALPATQIDFD